MKIEDNTTKSETPKPEEVLKQEGYQLNGRPESAPLKRGRGRPKKKRGRKPKNPQLSQTQQTQQGQSTAPEIKEPKVQERWRQLVNIIPEASVWVSD